MAKAAKKPFHWFQSGPTLSKKESAELAEPLESALNDGFKYGDQFIWYKTQDTTQLPVWSDVDDDEIKTLVRVLLRKGETSPAAASVVRTIVQTGDWISVAIILGPRMITTADRLAKAPKKPKKPKKQRGTP